MALIDREPDPFPCPLARRHSEEGTCWETWVTAWMLEGETLEEARQALAESRFIGTAYHLSDCELLDDRPREDGP